ncbi:thioredoxin family protein [Mucilaginibacter sp. 3215]|uniref:thioredoxin family protein n=1 Tax=Mucilaginibacter sp. 3215 TaxID=3373912 RepID=UPI003D213032
MKNLLHISYFIALIALVSSSTAKAQETTSKSSTQINFIENSWTEALKQAARQNKYIFVDAYATWCGPCKMLKATTFKNNKVADFYNDNFVNVAIDMEKGQGPALAAEWGLQAYPTMIIFTSKGKPVSGTVGYIRANDLIKFGRQALNK